MLPLRNRREPGVANASNKKWTLEFEGMFNGRKKFSHKKCWTYVKNVELH